MVGPAHLLLLLFLLLVLVVILMPVVSPINELSCWTVGRQTLVRAVNACSATRAIVTQAVHPTRLPSQVVDVDAWPVVTKM